MSNELTEKLKNGELKTGAYYIEWSYDCDPRPSYMIDFFDKEYNDGEFMLQRHKYIDEVLEPVPSYDEYKELVSKTELLEKKLEIANKALKEYAETETYDWIDSREVARKALKEMEGVR